MVSENIQELKDFWSEFEKQIVINMKDVRGLSDKLAHVFETFRQLESSRDKWRIRAEKAEKELREINKNLDEDKKLFVDKKTI